MDVTKNGDIINWLITITNNGPSANTNVKVQDSIAPGLIYQSYTIGPPEKGTFNMSTGLWTVGTHNVGVSYTILIKYRVVDISLATAESDAYGFALSAVISGDNIDPNDINNTKTAFVGITTCAPSAGAVNDIPACLCGTVAANDTPCTHGTTQYRITVGSLVNLDPSFTLDIVTGEYNAMGKILDPFEPASFTYSIWCIVGLDELQTSGPATVEIPALFAAAFTDTLVDNGDGTITHTSVAGVITIFNIGNVGTVYPSVIVANVTLTILTLRNFTKIDDSGYVDIQIVLPDPATLGLAANKTYTWTFKRINLFDGGSITLVPDNFKTIDGQASYVFPGNDYTSITIWTDGVNYWIA